MTLQPSSSSSEVRKMPERWWINVCPECNGLVDGHGQVQAHNETCPNRGRVFVAKAVEVSPVLRWVGKGIDDLPDVDEGTSSSVAPNSPFGI